jgi:hypothetical protein
LLAPVVHLLSPGDRFNHASWGVFNRKVQPQAMDYSAECRAPLTPRAA